MISGQTYELRHTAGVLPSTSAVSLIAATFFFFTAVALADVSCPLRASAHAQTSVPAHVRKSFAVTSRRVISRKALVMGVYIALIAVTFGLFKAVPKNIIVLPVLFEGEVRAVLELATFDEFDEIRLTFLEQLAETIGIVLNTIGANMRTEELLRQSQALTENLQSQQDVLTETNKRLEQQTRSLQKSEELLKKQQDELQRTNAELEEKAQLLAGQKAEVEQKNQEVEQAKVALEEKAEQLALTSKYKSEFLANMSHELRTPLAHVNALSETLLLGRAESPEQAQRWLRAIHREGRRLSVLTENVLLHARGERRGIRAAPQWTDLGAVVRVMQDHAARLIAFRSFTP